MGQTSAATVTVTVNVEVGGVVASVAGSSQGAPTSEFKLVAGGTCAPGAVTVGQTCTAVLQFAPKYPGLRSGAATLLTAGGTVIGQGLVNGVATGGLSVLKSGTISTYAGSGSWIYDGDGRQATDSAIFLPQGLARDASGNLYFSDSANNRVRRVDTKGVISTVAGGSMVGSSGDNGLATSAALNQPTAIILDGGNNLYIVDTGNNCVRRVDGITQIITTYAGICGKVGNSGDGGPATSALMRGPQGLAMDMAGNLYISDTSNQVIRKVDATTGTITRFAGNGDYNYNGDNIPALSAAFNQPWGLAIGLDHGLYVADQFHFRIRRIDLTSNIITTVAGNGVSETAADGTPALQAGLAQPATVTLDPAGNIYIGDGDSNLVRMVSVRTGTLTTVVNGSPAVASGGSNPGTVTGTGTGIYGDGGPADQSTVYGPYGLLVDQTGNLFVSDMFHNRIRFISGNSVALPTFTPLKVQSQSSPVKRDLENIGNGTFNLLNFNGGSNTTLAFDSTTCVFGPMVSGADCFLGVQFAPQTTGNDVQGSLVVNTDALNTPATVLVHGQVLSVTPTTLALTSSANPSLVTNPVTFTGTITPSGVTGTVSFFDGNTSICTDVAVTGNAASCTVSALSLGSHTITARYSGDDKNAAATSPSVVQVVQQASSTTLSAAPNPATVTTSVTMIAAVTVQTGTATGSVVFYDGTSALGNAPVDGTGHATFSTVSLPAGTRALTAHYSGDSTNVGSVSPAVSEVINLGATTTTLTTSANSATVGTSLTFTASVAGTVGQVPTGTVQFQNGAVVLGSAPITNGRATFSYANLAPGTYAITAKYLADSNNEASVSNSVSETIQQITTSIVLVADKSTATAGQSVNLTATVTKDPNVAADGAITGSITFYDGTTVLGTANVDGNGKAALAVTSLKVASHAITALYSGNVNYGTSTSEAVSVTVGQTPTATSLSASGKLLTGTSLTLTAAVTSSTGIPTGAVAFYDGTVSLGSASVNAQGIATLVTTTLTTGNHSLTAVYAGDASYITSTSAGVPEVIAQAQPTLVLTGPTGPVNANTTVTLNASLLSNGATPTGALTLQEGSAAIASQRVAASGTFTFSVSTLPVGTHMLTVSYGGDLNNTAALSNVVTVVVQQGAAGTALTTSKNPQTLGQPVTFTAAVTSPSPNVTGTISFLDGATVLGSVPVAANGTASLTTSTLTFGVHSVTASYSGDAAHAASVSPAISQRIVQNVLIGLNSSLNPAVTGNAVTFTIRLSGGTTTAPSGTVSILDESALLGTATLDASGTATYTTSTLAVGSHTITVTYPGDTNYAAATSAPLVETVTNANTSVVLTGSANPATFGNVLTLQAAVSSNGGIATGTVTFNDGGVSIGSSLLNAQGVATLATANLLPGVHTLVAQYAGDGKASQSVSTPLVVVVKQATTVALTSSANPASTLSAVTFAATVGNAGKDVPAGVVTFTDGATTLGTATLDATGNASITVPQLSAGSHAITAAYAGNDTNFGSVSPALSQTVSKRPTTTSLTATVDPNNSQQITLIAILRWTGSVSPTGTVTFTNGTSVVGSAPVDGAGVASLTINNALQSMSLVATYAGDTAYEGSASPLTTIAPEQNPQFTLSLNPPAMTLVSKQHSTALLTITSPGAFSDTLEYGCLGLPFAATCTFSQTTGTLKPGSTVQVTLTVDTGNPLGAGGSASVRSQTSSTVLECVLPASFFAGLLMFRRRRIKLAPLLVLLVAIGVVFSTTGCGGLNVNGTPAGKYTFQVTARGQNTNVTESQTMTLTVTQ